MSPLKTLFSRLDQDVALAAILLLSIYVGCWPEELVDGSMLHSTIYDADKS